jgi:hypothetical protein
MAVTVLSAPAVAVTGLVYDAEPNDAPHQAVAFSMPGSRDLTRLLGELEGNDQDAFRVVIDEDQAGRRFNLRLTGRAGALTRLDVFDFSALADGRGRIPEALEAAPARLLTLQAADGSRPVQTDALLFSPGVYVFGVSHSGGAGAYSVDLVEHDSSTVRVLDESHAESDPLRLTPGRREVVWTAGEAWFRFDIDADQAAQPWDFEFQSALGIAASAELVGPDGAVLLALETEGGAPLRRAGLSLAEGEYTIRTEQKAAGVQWLALPQGAPSAVDGMEREPNDKVPMMVPFAKTIRGRFDDKDTDFLRFEVDAEAAARRWDLELRSGPEDSPELCLRRDSIRLNDCERGQAGLVRQASLGFSPGEYVLRLVGRGVAGAEWELNWVDRGPLRPGEESEPNDLAEFASPLHERGFGRGSFEGGQETDYWRFNVTGEAQLWRIQKQGEDIHDLSLQRLSGETLATERPGNATRVRLDNLFLLPGEYLIVASGKSGDYTLRVQPLGPPPPGMELEPNDRVSNARQMRFGQEYFGLLAEEGDQDRYRFTLLGHEQLRILLQPPADGRVRMQLGLGDEADTVVELQRPAETGTPSEWRGFLPPGEYSIQLSPFDISDAEYRLTLFREDALAAIADREPNDWAAAAAPFPIDGIVEGRLGNSRAAQDWYALPRLDAPTALQLPDLPGVRYQVLERATDGVLDPTHDRDAGQYRFELAAATDYLLQLRGAGDYRLDLSALAPQSARPAPGPTLEIELPAVEIQAFSPWSQRLDGQVVVANPGAESLDVSLKGQLTDLRWQLVGLPESVVLGAGESRSLPFSIEVAPDAVVEPDVQLSIRARSGQMTAGATTTVGVGIDAVAVAPEFHWSVPEPLRGGFNAAASRFGAALVASPNIPDNKLDEFLPLFDGLARYGRWTESQLMTPGSGPQDFQQPTLRLAGDDAVSVRGFLLNPTSTLHTRQMLGKFEIALSMDGQIFDTVLAGELQPLAVEQAFALPQAVPARYARLIPISGALGDTGSLQKLKLGEFKVIAEAGWRPTPVPFNLADPANGGHLVWGQPWINGSAFNHDLLLDDDKSLSVRLGGSEHAIVVLGFEHARAARIAGVRIEPMPIDTPGGVQAESVRLLVSSESPLGPWTQVGESELGDAPATLALESPAWARYVRLDFRLPEGAVSIRYPDRIVVLEADGPSVLGEWGHLANVGPFEAENAPRPPALDGQPANVSHEAALTLQAGMPASGRALLDAYSSWYRVASTGNDNRLELILRGRPTLEGAPRLTDASGSEVTLYPIDNGGVEARWEAYVEPGASYWLEVFEPPRSVIFSWDTSGSVAAWLPTIANALLTYAESIKPGRDEVNLLPFGRSSPLLEGWQGHPYPLMRMLAADPQETSSSNAEGALGTAAEAMIGRPGKKAVLLLTDAATTSDSILWPALHQGRPQVFAMKLSSEGAFGGNPIHEVDLMQDWAQVRGGHFEYISSQGALGRGFDRAVAWLKRPVDFEVEVSFSFVEDPDPARLRVVSGALAPAARGAVEIILDASGSMLKRIDGQRRIEIARAAIRQAVEHSLPDGLPLALRVYGHREAGSCRTDLEIPLAPLDKSAFLERVDAVQAINLARTPIADSLAAVARDLAGVEGRKLVVLLTDGEETCDGDPAAVIAKLAEDGVDVRINIVGFALDDEAVKRQFSEWAELGGGMYLDAAEAAALDAALEQSLRLPFSVLDGNGEAVASGLVDGEQIELPPGRYTLRIDTAVPRRIENVELTPGGEMEVKLD